MFQTIMKFKKIMIGLILSVMLLSSYGKVNESNAFLTTGMGTNPDIVVRCGEYGNDEEVKAGKRIYIDNKTYKQVKDKIKVREDKKGLFISEFDVNVKLGTRIAQKLSEKGAKVDLQISTKKSEDLNAAGRLARSKTPDIYFSVHHNAFDKKHSGYLFIVNNKDVLSEKVAKQLSDSMVDNPMKIPQMKNRYNVNNYIGEMNEMNKIDSINILGEFGFFDNPKEIVKIVDDKQVEYIAEQMSNELIETLKTYKAKQMSDELKDRIKQENELKKESKKALKKCEKTK